MEVDGWYSLKFAHIMLSCITYHISSLGAQGGFIRQIVNSLSHSYVQITSSTIIIVVAVAVAVIPFCVQSTARVKSASSLTIGKKLKEPVELLALYYLVSRHQRTPRTRGKI